jgi:hypothetical protein
VSANGSPVGRWRQLHRDPPQLVFDKTLYADGSFVTQAPLSREPDNIPFYTLFLSDVSLYEIYRRYFTAEQLANEINGRVLFAGRWFVMVTR